MSHLLGQTLLLEDIAVASFVHSSLGMIVVTLLQGCFSAPSWQTFTSLACGWSLATDRHPITTSVWLTGATVIKHFSRFYVFLGGPLYHKRWQLWGAIIRLAARFVPEGVVIRVIFDDTTVVVKYMGDTFLGLSCEKQPAHPDKKCSPVPPAGLQRTCLSAGRVASIAV